MNAAQAKQAIKITSFLSTRGIEPRKIQGSAYWYCSPFRDEKTPSFEVHEVKNIWRDHGSGQGGDVIKLVMMLYSVEVSGALKILNESEPAPKDFSSFHQQKTINAQPAQGLVINKVQALQNAALLQYVESRGIPAAVAKAYVQECYFRTPTHTANRDLFALAFKNDAGGYELRNAIWKGASSPKGYTTIPASEGDKTTLAVFEGFFDFLSACVYFQKPRPVHTVLVLNSAALLESALPLIRQYERVNLFLDNDSTGKRAVNVISQECKKVVDYSAIYYPSHKDFNEFLTTTKYLNDNAK